MKKADRYFYAGMLGTACIATSLMTNVIQNAHPQRTEILQPSLSAFREMQEAQSALDRSDYKPGTPQYQTLLSRVEASRENYTAITAQPAVQDAIKNENNRAIKVALNLGTHISLSMIALGLGLHGWRLRQRNYNPQ